ncbi:MAG TPA: hypothetical protein DIU15_15995 [Deltaproteobacteria bacterium]|nr:hypothetical protein [Deltaproteobacteria bacterium]HCP47543.1 hypothetical protein [Deltaproteobacteria bacterium]
MHSKGFFDTTFLLILQCLVFAGCSPTAAPSQPSDGEVGAELPPTLGELRGDDERAPVQASVDSLQALPPWFRLIYSQDNRGELEPCGCPGSPTGGLARRRVLLAELEKLLPDALVVEGPTALSRAVLGIEVIRGEHRSRARLILELIGNAGAAAFFPGQADFEVIRPEEMAQLAGHDGLQLVATNLAPEMRSRGYRPYLLHTVKDRRVVLLGLIGSAGNEEARRRVPRVDTVASASAAVAQARREAGGVDLVVAFTDGDGRDQAQWLDAGLDVDLLLVPPSRGGGSETQWQGGRYRVESEPLGRSFRRVDVVFTGPEGRHLGPISGEAPPVRQVAAMEELMLLRSSQSGTQSGAKMDELLRALSDARETRDKGLDALRGLSKPVHLVAESLLTLRPEVPEDSAVKARLRSYRQDHLRDIEKRLASGPPAESDQRYLGHDSCIQCHPEVAAQWARSPHASGWLHLAERGETGNPDCLTCHTTGFGRSGGFVDPEKDKSLLNVQCEACHGPMALHVTEAANRGFRPKPGRPVLSTTCTACHDEANSPDFDCETYLPRVAHPRALREGLDTMIQSVCGSK